LDRDLTRLRDSESYNIDEITQNIAEAPQISSLGEMSPNSLDNVSSQQIQLSDESSFMPSNEVANANYPSQSSNESSLDASLSTTDVLNLDKAIQRQVDLDNGRTDVDISTIIPEILI